MTVKFDQDDGYIRKNFLMPSNSTIHFFRKKVSEDSGIPFHQVRLSINQQILMSREIEELYDITTIKQRVVFTRMDDDMRLQDIDRLRYKFKAQLKKNQDTIDNCILLLSSEDEEIRKEAWKLLDLLPPSENITTAIE